MKVAGKNQEKNCSCIDYFFCVWPFYMKARNGPSLIFFFFFQEDIILRTYKIKNYFKPEE